MLCLSRINSRLPVLLVLGVSLIAVGQSQSTCSWAQSVLPRNRPPVRRPPTTTAAKPSAPKTTSSTAPTANSPKTNSGSAPGKATATAPTSTTSNNAASSPVAPAESKPETPEPAAPTAPEDSPTPPAGQYLLRYKFKLGEQLKWTVEHHARVRTTVAGTTQTAETDSASVKVWVVQEVDKQGNVKFEHRVESIRMRQRLSGRQEETYDSTVDKEVPATFRDAANSVGVPLTVVRMDSLGRVIQRFDHKSIPGANQSQLTLPLPKEAIAIGHRWTVPHEVDVRLEGGQIKKIQTRQDFVLEEVKNGVATINVSTVILTPVREPSIEAQLIQQATGGKVRFDIDAGRMLGQQMDLDKQVQGFSGEASSMHYVTRFEESLLSGTQTANRPKVAGPPLPK